MGGLDVGLNTILMGKEAAGDISGQSDGLGEMAGPLEEQMGGVTVCDILRVTFSSPLPGSRGGDSGH